MKIVKVCRVILTAEEIKVAADMEELLNQFPDDLCINGVTMECSDEELIEYEESEDYPPPSLSYLRFWAARWRSRHREFPLYHSLGNLSRGKMNKNLTLRNPEFVQYYHLISMYSCAIILLSRGDRNLPPKVME